MSNFRIDPIDKFGNFDVDFFASEEYKDESRKLHEYLLVEGFDETDKPFFIDFRNRRWEINPIQKRKKRK
jgi:hypothetical protein